MLDFLLCMIVKLLLALRYRIRVRGLDKIARRGTGGILFLPNHPALIDPIILMAYLHERFAPRALADKDQVNRPFIRWLSRRVGVVPVPDIKLYGPSVRGEVEAAVNTSIESLKRGGNLLFYPSGHIYRTRHEDLRGNSGAEEILRKVPDVRVVLVRTRGLWGSSFSLAGGEYPRLAHVLRIQLWNLLRNLLLLMTRRAVTIELHEPADLPRQADRHTLNAFLERYYNEDAPPNTYVAYRWGQRPRSRELPDPQWGRSDGALSDVPAATRNLVTAHLSSVTGVATIRDEQRLAQDLDLDSLARAELLLWITREFGHVQQDGDAVQTVGDVMLAACGQAIVTRPTPLKPPPADWFRDGGIERISVPPGATIPEVFLAAARGDPGRIVVADQLSGAKSYRNLITTVLALKPVIERLEGQYIGIMLPASVGAGVVYLATLLAGKVPVMLNWTTGARSMAHTLGLIDLRYVLTAGALLGRLKSQGIDLGPIKDRLLLIEDLRKRISTPAKLWALIRSYVSWSPLSRARVPKTAVVLVTSGSESLPKAVPLTHANLLANVRDVIGAIHIRSDDRMLGFLPPFHSFGLTVTLITPLLTGLRTVYHPNPTEALTLTRLIGLYRATILLGTPTFLSGILRAATSPRVLASLRLAVTGAEKCPQPTYQALAERCPQAAVLEGYGITECSPVVAVNRPEEPCAGTIGKVMPSLEYALVDVDFGELVPRGQQGLLLVRGPSVFGGYLGGDAASPFVEHDGKQWYRTGDLVSEDADGVLTFRGRLKRFVKLGGEMISLPAVEAALTPHYAAENDEGSVIAVVATADDTRPELVLFTTRPTQRQAVNKQLRAAGLSPLHNIRRVVQVNEIPLLGNGKTDYRALQEQLGKR